MAEELRGSAEHMDEGGFCQAVVCTSMMGAGWLGKFRWNHRMVVVGRDL